MRSRELPIQHVRPAEVDLAERLRVTAGRLAMIPADLASSLSLTAGRQGYSEAEIRHLAASIATQAHMSVVVESDADMITILFRRSHDPRRQPD